VVSTLSPAAVLKKLLLAEPTSFPFYRALAILERIAPSGTIGIGAMGPVAREHVRFVHDPSLSFPAGDITHIHEKEAATGTWWAEVSSTFLGLIGTRSRLATHFTEEVLELEAMDGDRAIRTLYDILHHRLYGLIYRAGRKYRFAGEARQDG